MNTQMCWRSEHHRRAASNVTFPRRVTMTRRHCQLAAAACALLMTLSACARKATPTEIRIRNGSDSDFQAVVVGGVRFGDIKAGAATDYRAFSNALPIADANLVIGSNRLSYMPIDYVGYEPLGPGRFSYVLDIERGKLRIRSEKDR